MKWLFCFYFFILHLGGFGQQLDRQQLRNLFLQALERKGALDTFSRKLEKIEKKTPAEEGYFGLCYALFCQYDDGNWAKLKHVIKSKNHLNSAVERDSKDPELRFLRFVLEHFLPSFLGLNKHINDDLKVILANTDIVAENPALKRRIVEFLLASKRCTSEQSRLLRAQMEELSQKSGP